MTESDLIKLGNRVIDKQGNVVYFNEALVEMLYNDNIPQDILFSEQDCDIKAFNKLSYENFDDVYFKIPTQIKSLSERKNIWFYPPEYDSFPLEDFFLEMVKNKTKKYKDRVLQEIALYKEKGMEKFLRFCIYLSVVICEQDLVVGVGRGSSCSSLLLYLLQIHLIDPIQYGLDIKEFLK